MTHSHDLYVLRHRVDWQLVLQDMHDAGCTGYRVAQLLGIEWSTVQRWLSGSEPRHSYGVAILELHTKFCGTVLTQKRLNETFLAA